MFPIMGLFLFFIPFAGLIAAIGLYVYRPLRFFAPFAFFIPLLSSYGAVFGAFGLAVWLENHGLHGWIPNMSAVIGFFLGGALGLVTAIMLVLARKVVR